MNLIHEKLKARVHPDLWSALEDSEAMVAGGALTSLYTNAPINDLDVYFKSAEHFTRFIEYIYETELTLENTLDDGKVSQIVQVHGTTPKSLLMQTKVRSDQAEPQMVQAITYQFFPEVSDLFKSFDFTINMAAIDIKTGHMEMHPNFLLHNCQRHLSFNQGTSYPVMSLLRVRKYEERGYKISKSQMLRIALTIAQLKINSWEELRNHCGGMYGMKLSEVFDETKEFSLDTAIEQLGDLAWIDNMPTYSKDSLTIINLGQVYEAFKDILKIQVPAGKTIVDSNRIFKNVNPSPDGGWQSAHMPSFKYELGGVVNGGKEGIFAYYGMDVKYGMYHNPASSVVLELAPATEDYQQPVPYDTDCKIRLYGDWRVVAAWPAKVFDELFTGTTKNNKKLMQDSPNSGIDQYLVI